MSTPYSEIINLFLDKIEQDTDFFKYDALSEYETMEIINTRCKNILNLAIRSLQPMLDETHNINLLNRDEDMEEFKDELNDLEIDLISEAMVLEHYNIKRAKLGKINTYLGSSSMKVFSPAEERKSYLQFMSQIRAEFYEKLDNYNLRIRGKGDYIY